MYYYKSEQNFEKVAGPQTVTLPKMSSITSISILFVQVSIFLLILISDVYYVTQGNFSSLSSVAAFTFNWSDVDILRKARVNFIS